MLDNFEHKAREIYNRLLLEGKNLTAENIKNEITGLEVYMFELKVTDADVLFDRSADHH